MNLIKVISIKNQGNHLLKMMKLEKKKQKPIKE